MAKAKKGRATTTGNEPKAPTEAKKKRKPPAVRGPGGRKPGAEIILTDNELGKLEAMTGMGLSLQMCAIELGISKATLERRMNDTPEVRTAINEGRVKAHARVAKTAFQMAVGTSKQKAIPRMTRYWLNCRAGWRETKHLEIDDLSKQDPIDVTPQQKFVEKLATMSQEEVDEMLRKKKRTTDS